MNKGHEYENGKEYNRKTADIRTKKDVKQGKVRKKEWKQDKLRRLKAAGKSYISKANKISKLKTRWEKKRKPKSCKCRFTECSQLTEEELEPAFKNYYSIRPTQEQKLTLLQNVQDAPKKRCKSEDLRPEDKSLRRNKEFRRIFKIDRKVVCKKLFMETYDMSSAAIHRIISKRRESDGIIKQIDGRGKHGKQKKVAEDVIRDLKEFVARLPKYSSHYGREKDDKCVLTLAPNITKVKLYKEFLKDKDYNVSESWFMKSWNGNIPVRTYRHHVDTCNICDDKNISNKEKINHQRKAYLAHQEMIKDDNAIAFDLQKAHSLPLLTTNKAYYAHPLVLYNEGMHVCNNQGYAHLWDETTGKRGSCEIACIIYRFVKKYADARDTLSFWCDNCGGQNKNQYIAQAMMYIVNTVDGIKEINIRFPYTGHTFLADDSNFSCIEKKDAQKELFYFIDDCAKCISDCNSYRKDKIGTKKKIIVHKMKREEFYNFSIDGILVKRNIDLDDNASLWSEIHHMKFIQGEIKMHFRYDCFGDLNFHAVDMGKRGISVSDIQAHILSKLHVASIKITGEKYVDIMDQLQFIPPCYHDFYKSLPHKELKKKDK